MISVYELFGTVTNEDGEEVTVSLGDHAFFKSQPIIGKRFLGKKAVGKGRLSRSQETKLISLNKTWEQRNKILEQHMIDLQAEDTSLDLEEVKTLVFEKHAALVKSMEKNRYMSKLLADQVYNDTSRVIYDKSMYSVIAIEKIRVVKETGDQLAKGITAEEYKKSRKVDEATITHKYMCRVHARK